MGVRCAIPTIAAVTQAISINEFHAPRWSSLYTNRDGQTMLLGRAILNSSDLDSYGLFILIGIGALMCYIAFYNVVVCIAMKKLSCEAPIHHSHRMS